MLQRILSLLKHGDARTSSHMIKPIEGIAFGWGTTVGNGIEGWAPGALFVHTSGATAADYLYSNAGTKITAVWTVMPIGVASVANGLGASLIGVEDSAGDLVATTVEAALAEIAGNVIIDPTSEGIYFDDFLGSDLYVLGLVPAGWSVIDSSTSGTPTVNESPDCHGGAVELACDNQDELQVIGLYFNDELLFDIDKLKTFECRFRAPTLDASEEIIIGMISDQNDAPASLTEGAWISVDGAQAIHCESDDTNVRLDDQDSTVVLGNDVWCNLKIDFTDKASIKFYLDVAGTAAPTRVLPAVTFVGTAYAAGLQPAMYLQKTGGATTPNLDIDYVRIVFAR